MNLQAAGSREDRPGDYHHMSVENPLDTLEELCILLEDHAPSWYSETQRKRVLVARRLPMEVLVELCALLEDYSPSWYTEEQHDRAISVLRALGVLDGAWTSKIEPSELLSVAVRCRRCCFGPFVNLREQVPGAGRTELP